MHLRLAGAPAYLLLDQVLHLIQRQPSHTLAADIRQRDMPSGINAYVVKNRTASGQWREYRLALTAIIADQDFQRVARHQLDIRHAVFRDGIGQRLFCGTHIGCDSLGREINHVVLAGVVIECDRIDRGTCSRQQATRATRQRYDRQADCRVPGEAKTASSGFAAECARVHIHSIECEH
ncbi:hypothetical protein D3C71_1670450 [compost metagenome]